MWRQLALILTLSAGATMAQILKIDKIDVGSKISDKDIGVKVRLRIIPRCVNFCLKFCVCGQ